MAKAKKKAATKKFLLGFSDCGGLHQFETNGETFATLAAAKAAIEKDMESGQSGDEGTTFYILSVVAIGAQPRTIQWKE